MSTSPRVARLSVRYSISSTFVDSEYARADAPFCLAFSYSSPSPVSCGSSGWFRCRLVDQPSEYCLGHENLRRLVSRSSIRAGPADLAAAVVLVSIFGRSFTKLPLTHQQRGKSCSEPIDISIVGFRSVELGVHLTEFGNYVPVNHIASARPRVNSTL